MLNKFTKFTAIFIATALLGGCFPSGKNETANIGNAEQSAVSDNNEKSVVSEQAQPENVIFDLNASVDLPSEMPSIKLTLKKWDKDELERLLLDGKEITEQTERDCQFYPNEKLYSYDTADKFHIYFEPGRLLIDDENELGGEFKYGSFDGEPCLASNDELPLFSRENAVSRVNAFLDKLGITNYGEPLIIPLKADNANEILATYRGRKDKLGNEFEFTPWTENEEIYILTYPFVFENTELAMTEFFIPQSNNKVSVAPHITALVTKDKIIRLSANGVYSASYETVENVPINYDFNKTLEELKKFYSYFTPEYPIKFYSEKSVYIPRKMTNDKMTVTFGLGWEFSGYSEIWKYTPPFDRCPEYQYFYADTGYRYINE